MRRVLVVLLSLLAFSQGVWGKEAVPTNMDPLQQKRAVELEANLRCLVCQNQTIADSNAELAQDLRRQVREQIAAGRTDTEIVGYMVQRYGDFVLYNPPVKMTTILLWFGPFLLLVLGVFALWRHVKMRNKRAEPMPLSEDERRRAGSLLGETHSKGEHP
jgi:cytochrome c-type biogenesis protein CcmH